MNRSLKVFAGFGCAAALAACTTGQTIVYDNEGVSVSRFSNDYGACVAEAELQAPVIIQNQTSYGATIGVGTGGYSRGWYGGGSGVGLSVDTRRVDVNAGRRIGLMQQCMSARGYIPKQIPNCSSEVRNSTVISQSYRQPPVTQQSCAANLQGLGPVILTP